MCLSLYKKDKFGIRDLIIDYLARIVLNFDYISLPLGSGRNISSSAWNVLGLIRFSGSLNFFDGFGSSFRWL